MLGMQPRRMHSPPTSAPPSMTAVESPPRAQADAALAEKLKVAAPVEKSEAKAAAKPAAKSAAKPAAKSTTKPAAKKSAAKKPADTE